VVRILTVFAGVDRRFARDFASVPDPRRDGDDPHHPRLAPGDAEDHRRRGVRLSFPGPPWADTFAVLEIIEPGLFVLPDSPVPAADLPQDVRELAGILTYYSLVTISTLGYGDIVPVTGPAQSFAAIEAITGQFYIAILIAPPGQPVSDQEGRRIAGRPAAAGTTGAISGRDQRPWPAEPGPSGRT
jgi:hypothetical protein